MNQLYFGDNLDIMKRMHYQEHKAEFIDLIYIDPPFNSKRNYNVLFESAELENTKAQKEAFADTWSNVSYLDTLNEIKEIDLNLYHFLNALDSISISKSAISYLATMAIRIWYMHKLLKPTGSFYLHCDPTMSHYLKIVCDLIFGENNFHNEIVWKRTSGHSDAIGYGNIHDLIFFYTKSQKSIWNQIFQPYDREYVESYYRYKDPNGRLWMSDNLSAKGLSGGGYEYEWRGIKGYWRCPIETMIKLDKEGRIYYTKNRIPRRKRYLDESKGLPVQDLWVDIEPIRSWHKEKLGYPTQKPESLLERIIKASSNEGDLVADFFCGCGTTISAAQNLSRSWIGSDISHLAVKLITKRLIAEYSENIKDTFEIHGFPKDLDSAKELAAGVKGGRLQFEEWIIEVLLHGILNDKRNVMGYDGYFIFDINGNKNVALIEVKSGNASPSQLNHFIRTVEDKKAQMGIFVCFADQVTDNMKILSKKQGYFSEYYKKDKIQILTVEDLLDGKQPDRPESRIEIFKQAERKTISDAQQKKLF